MASAWKTSGVSLVTSDRPRVRGDARCFERVIYNEELALDPSLENHTLNNASTRGFYGTTEPTDIAMRGEVVAPRGGAFLTGKYILQEFFVDESTQPRFNVTDVDPRTGLWHIRATKTGGVLNANWRWLELNRPGECVATPQNSMSAYVVPGATLTLSAYMKVDRTDTDVSVLVDFDFHTDFYPFGSVILGTGMNTLHDINSTSYVQYSHSREVPAEAKIVRAFFWPRFVGGAGLNAATTLDIDDMSLVMTPA